MIALALLIAGAIGALIDLTLHLLQLWPHLEPSRNFTRRLTGMAGLLMMASCLAAPNPAALVMGLGVFAMAVFSALTGKELD